MFSSKIKIEKELLNKCKKYAQMAGYSSVEEFVSHTLERAVKELENSDSEEDIKKRLQGLGYIS